MHSGSPSVKEVVITKKEKAEMLGCSAPSWLNDAVVIPARYARKIASTTVVELADAGVVCICWKRAWWSFSALHSNLRVAYRVFFLDRAVGRKVEIEVVKNLAVIAAERRNEV